jgi:hypothetical protein
VRVAEVGFVVGSATDVAFRAEQSWFRVLAPGILSL